MFIQTPEHASFTQRNLVSACFTWSVAAHLCFEPSLCHLIIGDRLEAEKRPSFTKHVQLSDEFQNVLVILN